jgi:hypothetical protein
VTASTVYLPTDDENALPFVETAGGHCVPVFSSLEALQHHRPEGGRYLRVPREALSTLCPDGVGVLLDGRVALTSAAASQLTTALVGEPKEEPEELLAVVCAFASGRSDVRHVHRAQVVPPAGTPAICIGFEVDDGADERAILESAAAAIAETQLGDVLLAPLGEGGELARFLRERTTPVWVREAS